MVTIKDVAQAAGVSVSTVSRVINQNGYVSRATRDRVHKAMSELNFAPSHVARGLVSRRTSTVGLLIPDVSNPFFSDVARGTEDAAIARGFTVILCNSDWKPEREQMYLNLLRGKWAEGVIVVGSRSRDRALRQAVADLPFVLVDRRASADCSFVWSDNEKGAVIATEHLVQVGCTRLVHISGPVNSPSAAARRRGFTRTARRLRIPHRIEPGNFRYDSGFEVAMRLLQEENPPDGIFAGNDMMAIGVIQAASQLGVKIPREVAVVGYDNVATAEYTYPTLTTVEQPGYAMGAAAFDMLFRLLSAGCSAGTHEQLEFEPKLIQRQSTLRTAY